MLKKLKKIPSTKNSIKSIPENPGIYIFWNATTPIYIGKALNLRRRLTSYFSIGTLEKTRQMVDGSKSISFIEVASEVEALLLEAELVWKHKPKFNRALKDDKHPLYIMITKDTYPRILAAKRSDLEKPHKKLFGPFPSSGNLKYVLRMLRPIFPYSNHLPTKRACLYSQMGLCDPCPSLIENSEGLVQRELKAKYLKNVSYVSGVLSGRIKTVRSGLVKDMDFFSSQQIYEEAREVKEKISRLDYITARPTSADKFIENPNLIEDLRVRELEELKTLLNKFIEIDKLMRIECFDVAHLTGSHPAASMVTFVSGEADKNLYRHFRIKKARGGDDTSSLEEVALRREKRLKDWGKPDLIIVDGGRGQTRVFNEVFLKHNIPVIGLAKRFETLVIPQGEKLAYKLVRPRGPALFLVQRIRDEAHRFARRYHHTIIKKYLTQVG